MKKDIDICFEREKVDWVIVEFPQMLGNISCKILNSNKLIISQHNIEYATLNNLAKSITNPLKRAIYNVEAKRLYHFEKRYYREMSVKLFTFVSIEDKAFLKKVW